VIRFFQAVAMSRATIETLNLIPQTRRAAFDVRYKRLLVLCVGSVVLSILLYGLLLALGAAEVLNEGGAVALLAVDTAVAALFNLGLAWLFHCRPSESLKLWSATATDLGGFANLQEQDADLFD
jgi:hypothetical protein